MKIKAEIIKINECNKNGRIYTIETAKDILDTWKDHSFITFNFEGDEISFKDVCGCVTNVYLNEDSTSLIAEGELIDKNPLTDDIIQSIKHGFDMYLTITGTGCLGFDNKTVEDYELNYFAIGDSCSFEVPPMEIEFNNDH